MRLNIGKTGLRSEVWVRILFDACILKSANVVNLPLYQYTGELPFWFAEQLVAPLRRVTLFVEWSPSVFHSCVSDDNYSFPTRSCPAPGYPSPSLLAELGESAVFHLSELGWSCDPSWEKAGSFFHSGSRENVWIWSWQLHVSCFMEENGQIEKSKYVKEYVCIKFWQVLVLRSSELCWLLLSLVLII